MTGGVDEEQVVLDLSTEFYVFPPNETAIVKFAIHGYGCTHINPSTQRSEPVTGHFHPAASISTSDSARSASEGNLPADAVHALRHCLGRVLPGLAARPFSSTRMCWYTETSDSHFLIDRHPTRPELVLATGGSGHAFKVRLPPLAERWC